MVYHREPCPRNPSGVQIQDGGCDRKVSSRHNLASLLSLTVTFVIYQFCPRWSKGELFKEQNCFNSFLVLGKSRVTEIIEMKYIVSNEGYRSKSKDALSERRISAPCLVHAPGSVLVYRFTRADTKDQTIHNSKPMTPKQRKNNGYSFVNRYTRTEPVWLLYFIRSMSKQNTEAT